MSARKGGSRRGTRRTFRKHPRARGKVSLANYFAEFKIGERAVLKADPSVNNNLYHGRHHGRAGTITAKRGECYEIQIMDGNKQKMVIVHPVHLKRAQ